MADHSDDLDELLECIILSLKNKVELNSVAVALDDFRKIDLGSVQRGKDGIDDAGEEPSSSSSSSSSSSAAAAPSSVQGLGLGLPDLRNKKGKQKAMNNSHASEALEKLTQQTREAVRRLELTTAPAQDDLGKDGMMEDFVKKFEELPAQSQGMDCILKTMMQQLLSKEILHGPMTEIGERYPKWLESHKAVLSNEEYDC